VLLLPAWNTKQKYCYLKAYRHGKPRSSSLACRVCTLVNSNILRDTRLVMTVMTWRTCMHCTIASKFQTVKTCVHPAFCKLASIAHAKGKESNGHFLHRPASVMQVAPGRHSIQHELNIEQYRSRATLTFLAHPSPAIYKIFVYRRRCMGKECEGCFLGVKLG